MSRGYSRYQSSPSPPRAYGKSHSQNALPSAQNADDVAIAIMGATGSGKSTFINLISNSNLGVGDGLKSCTSKVETANTFELDGRLVTLVDTPGFDDTNLSDTDILKMIAGYLETTYKQGFRLSGVIYMHRISDFRVGGIARRNFHMFRKLCGDDTLKNVIIVTNMWGEVSQAKGEAREKQLRTDSALFKDVVDKGAKMLRHHNTPDSAKKILREIIDKVPRALRIQRELVDQGKDITETDAGEELDRELVALKKKHQEDLASLQKEMREALAQKDYETKQELEDTRRKLTAEIKKIQNDRDRLSREYAEEREKANQRMLQVEEELEQQREAREERQREIDQLQWQMQENHRASAYERAQMQQHYNQLVAEQKSSSGFFGKIGRWVDDFFGISD